ncbi:hypothetical protein FOA52_006905 [Chlamydomonas sp. UWO 241]|nr:hypothetical protein FOA52_006905 [Chlamydomonas sp. UWO 241]
MASVGARTVRVVVIGEPGTGKTSLISTAANDTFDARPPPVLPPVRLPRDFSPDGVPMLVTDVSSRPEDAAQLDLAVLHADAVVVTFDARRQSTLDAIRTVWYPRVQRLKPDVPVILACTKSDLLEELQDGQEIQQIRERVEAAVQDLSHVEVCLNCSSRTLRMVTDVFYYALKSVLYPLQPLYDRIDKRLRPLCVRALKRTFVMCDADGDGALCDAELNHFQQVCFNISLTDEELQNVKQVVQHKMPNGVVERGLTLEGFLFLHVLFIERGRLESVWAVLRKFGYNDSLHLADEVLDRVPWALPPDVVYELSDTAVDFLSRQFAAYDEDSDGLLTFYQMERMYSTVPPPMWSPEQWAPVLVPGTSGHSHRLDGFLLKWHYALMKDPRATVAHILYLGYGEPSGADAGSLLARCVRRRPEKKAEMGTRSTLHCYVFGPRGAGKTSALRALAGRGAAGDVVVEPGAVKPSAAVASVLLEDGREKVLIMTEVADDVVSEFMMLQQIAGSGSAAAARAATPPALPDLSKADAACFLFDSSSAESFRSASDMLVAVSTAAGDTLPCCLVACKDDLGMAQDMEAVVASACAQLCVALVSVSAAAGAGGDAQLGGLPRRVVGMAMRPEGCIPATPARRAQKLFVRQAVLYSATATGALVTGLLLYRLYQAAAAPAAGTTAPTRGSPGGGGGGGSHAQPQGQPYVDWGGGSGSSEGNSSGGGSGGARGEGGGGGMFADGVASISSGLSALSGGFSALSGGFSASK